MTEGDAMGIAAVLDALARHVEAARADAQRAMRPVGPGDADIRVMHTAATSAAVGAVERAYHAAQRAAEAAGFVDLGGATAYRVGGRLIVSLPVGEALATATHVGAHAGDASKMTEGGPDEAAAPVEITPEEVDAALARNRAAASRMLTSYRSLAEAAGVSEGTIRNWMRDGADGSGVGRPMTEARRGLGRTLGRLLRNPAH